MLDELRERLRAEGSVTLTVRAHPNAKKTQMHSMMEDGSVKIDIAAIPDDGKANAELVEFLADVFGVPRSHVELVSGQTNRRKVIRIRAVSA